MCGFAGVLTATPFGAAALQAAVCHMIEPLEHRGPDDSGVWTDHEAGIGLGFRRLAILDRSEHGHQPMASPSGRYVAVFNGEIYNCAGLRRKLEAAGMTFRGHSDTEVMVAAFERWGVADSIPRLSGMFAVAVWDADRRELSLFRDRMGKKPLYVYSEPGLITFGSELKALIAGPSFDRTIDRQALAAYLEYLYVPAPRTIFRGAIKVPPAHVLTIADPSATLPPARAYWSLREIAAAGLANPIACEAEAIDRLEGLLRDATVARMCADVPLGALLSGGIDSSTIVAMMQESSPRPIRTYTIGFDVDRFDETADARRVAAYLGTAHTDLVVSGDDARALIPRLATIFDEPLADPSQLPTYLVSQLARSEVTVALCGDGGDELFAGYNRYLYGTRMLPRIDRLPAPLRRGIAAGIGAVRAESWDRLAAVIPGRGVSRVGERAHKLARLMGADSTGHMYRSLLSSWPSDSSLVRGVTTTDDVNARILDEDGPRTLLDRMLLADQTTYLPDDLLAKVDRASMAVSLEVRAPMLDHRVVEFSWRLPQALKLRGRVGKWALRQVLYRHVPKAMVDRPKMGFSVPIDRWLAGPLRGWADDVLSAERLTREGLLKPEPIAAAWSDLRSGRRRTGAQLWAVAMFQAWKTEWRA